MTVLILTLLQKFGGGILLNILLQLSYIGIEIVSLTISSNSCLAYGFGFWPPIVLYNLFSFLVNESLRCVAPNHIIVGGANIVRIMFTTC